MQQTHLAVTTGGPKPLLFDVFDNAWKFRQDPTLVIGTIVVSPAPSDGKNPGCLYVKIRKHYVGKIEPDGTYVPAYDKPAARTPKVQAFIQRLITEPLEVIIEYGKWSKRCACCHQKLTDPKSIEAGIGPVCKRNWGL